MKKLLLGCLMASVTFVANAATDTFGTRVFQLIAKTKANENFVLSGESLKTVLLMLQEGAAGVTQQELSQALCGSSKVCQAEVLQNQAGYQAANAMWVQQGFVINPDFRTQILQQYHGDVSSVDFVHHKSEAINLINAWANKNTQGMIPKILQSTDVDKNTALVLTNAIYFEGFWPVLFDEKQTTKLPFSLLNGKSVVVPTMVKEDNYFTAKQNNLELVGLPYRDSNLELLIIMPTDAKRFTDLATNLSADNIQALVAKQQQRKFMLTLPKFTIASSYPDLKSTLQALGIRKVFTTSADLTKINAKAPLNLSKVIQKAIIKVDERGTKAAAVTAAVVMTRAMMPMKVEINRPFIFAIFDQKSKQLIFMGQVVNPEG